MLKKLNKLAVVVGIAISVTSMAFITTAKADILTIASTRTKVLRLATNMPE